MLTEVSAIMRSRYSVVGTGLNASMPSPMLCDLIGIPHPTLIRYIQQGIVTPAVQGTRGKNCAYRFSFRQCLGLAMVAAFKEDFGFCPSSLVKVWVDAAEATSDVHNRALIQSLRGPDSGRAIDPHLEEVTADSLIRSDGFSKCVPPEMITMLHNGLQRWLLVAEAFGV